ncbi:MAG: phosphatidylserine decarboxylase [Candidatus Thermoplasmatota archaeon]|nr:phosphatidylserine decarboxylase [Candidatus Thermoplasmatota archaeon]MBU1940545.1 phosphatidylserine decarboxylase [Candidatus Thermoplasmatota archaeon]
MKVAEGGLPWVATIALFMLLSATGILFFSGFMQLISIFFSLFFAVSTFLFILFFRDPERPVGTGIVAVADGYIQDISEVMENGFSWVRVATFMNIHNVHVNRTPLDGHITDVRYLPGGFIPAFHKDAERNERVKIYMDTIIGPIYIVLIAGTVARRIVPYVRKDDVVKKGDRIGLIRLGSRVDVYLPKEAVTLAVHLRDTMHAGMDTLATIND